MTEALSWVISRDRWEDGWGGGKQPLTLGVYGENWGQPLEALLNSHNAESML